MSAQIIPFPRRSTPVADRNPDMPEGFLDHLAAVQAENAGLTTEERLQRLASMIAGELAKAKPRTS